MRFFFPILLLLVGCAKRPAPSVEPAKEADLQARYDIAILQGHVSVVEPFVAQLGAAFSEQAEEIRKLKAYQKQFLIDLGHTEAQRNPKTQVVMSGESQAALPLQDFAFKPLTRKTHTPVRSRLFPITEIRGSEQRVVMVPQGR